MEKEPKFEKIKTQEKKPVQSRESIEAGKEPIVDIKIDKKTEKEIFEKYPDLEFLIDSVGTEYEELTEEEIKEGLEKVADEAGFPLDPESMGLEVEDIEDEEELGNIKKVILKNVFKNIGFDVKNPKIIKEREEETPGGEKVMVKYFEIKDPNLALCFDGINWVTEKKKEKEPD